MKPNSLFLTAETPSIFHLKCHFPICDGVPSSVPVLWASVKPGRASHIVLLVDLFWLFLFTSPIESSYASHSAVAMSSTGRAALLNLDNDSLSQILDLLPAESLFHLVLAGDITFNKVLAQLVRSFRLDYGRKWLMKWPRAFSYFPSLKSVHVAPETTSSLPYEHILELDVGILPKSLTSLELFCPNAGVAFLRPLVDRSIQTYQFADIGAMFPNLEKLAFNPQFPTSKRIVLDPILLPRSLKSLDFRDYPSIRISAHSLTSLPPTLEHLNFTFVWVLKSDISKTSFPPMLTSLAIHAQTEDVLEWLPKTLLTLKLVLQQEVDYATPLFPLPSNITDLTVTGVRLTPQTAPALIPRSLTRLSWRGAVVNEALAQLPPSLTLIDYDAMAVEGIANHREVTFASTVTQVLSQALIGLEAPDWEAEIPAWRSKFVISPEMQYVDGPDGEEPVYEDSTGYTEKMGALTRKLKDQMEVLYAYTPNGFQITLPEPMPKLVELTIDPGSEDGKIVPNSDWMQSCPSLTKLESFSLLDFVSLAKAPFTLEHLLVMLPVSLFVDAFSKVEEEDHNGSNFSSALMWHRHKSLASLTSLGIYIFPRIATGEPSSRAELPRDVLARILSYLPQGLKSAQLTPVEWEETAEAPSVPSSVFGRLPRGLRDLQLGEVDILPPGFVHTDLGLLPRNLRTLDFSATSYCLQKWVGGELPLTRGSATQSPQGCSPKETRPSMCDLTADELVELLPKYLNTFCIPGMPSNGANWGPTFGKTSKFLKQVGWRDENSNKETAPVYPEAENEVQSFIPQLPLH